MINPPCVKFIKLLTTQSHGVSLFPNLMPILWAYLSDALNYHTVGYIQSYAHDISPVKWSDLAWYIPFSHHIIGDMGMDQVTHEITMFWGNNTIH